MKNVSILILVLGVMATFVGALFKINDEPFGRELLLIGTIATWLGIFLVIYFFLFVKSDTVPTTA